MKKNQNCVIWIPFHCIHKTDDFYGYIAEDVETRFDTSNYELEMKFHWQAVTKRKK